MEISWKPLDSMRALAGIGASNQRLESKAEVGSTESSALLREALFPRASRSAAIPMPHLKPRA